MAIAHQLVSQALNTLCEQVRGGSFAVTNSDGATTRYGSDEPLFAVRFNDDNVISLGHDDLLTSFGEAYMDGRVAWKATQRQKLDHSLHKLRLHPHDPLLDIGCGWGALVMRAAEHYQANATGITLSEEQYARVNAAIAEQGLQHKASGRLADDNTLPREGRQFDQIVSIGMIEHVGKDNLAGFVQAVARLLKPGGLALLHSITAVREGSTTQWFERHMFPGAYIPTLLEMITHLGSGLNYFEPGLRLRYEIRREFAPYLGLGWLRRLGGTAHIARADGQDASDLALVVGVRVWH